MSHYKPLALRYIVGICVLAAVLSANSLVTRPAAWRTSWLPFVTLTIMAAISHLYPIRAARERSFYVVATVFVTAAIMALPANLLALHCLLGMLPRTILRRKQPRIWYGWAFNTAQTLVAALSIRWLLDLGGWTRVDGPEGLVLVSGAVLLFPLMQGLLVAGILWLNNGVRMADAGPLQPDALQAEVIMASIGALLAAVADTQPWFMVLLPGPLVLIHSLMRRVQMVHLADIDPKTGLYNYRYFEQTMSQEFNLSKRVRRSTAFMFLDLDYLRHINNRYGHLAGDHVIKEVAGVLSAHARSGDLVARFGGEEFVAMLPGTDRAEAYYVAERIRRAVEAHPFTFDGHPMRVTCSIGVAVFPQDGEEPADLIRRTDEALYMAKAQGRNRVCVAGSADGAMPGAPAEEQAPTEKQALAQVPALTMAAAAAAEPGAPPPAKGGGETAAGSMPPGHAAPRAEAPGPQAHVPSLQPVWFSRILPYSIAAVGGLVLVWVALRVTWPYAHTRALLFLMAVVMIAELLKVQVYESQRQGISVTMSSAVIMAGVALLDLAGAVAVALVSTLVHVPLMKKRDPEKILFNLGNITLSAASATVVFRQFYVPAAGGIEFSHLLAPLLSMLTYYVVNTGLLHLVITVRTRRPILGLWLENLWFGPVLVLVGLTGGFIGSTYPVIGPVGVLVFITPVMVLRYTFSLYASRAQRSIAELEEAKKAVEESKLDKERTLDQMIVTVAAIIDARDRSVFGHSRQVARYAMALAEEMNLPVGVIQRVRIGALLHDLGKIGIPEAILHKPGKLTPEEYQIIQHHAPLGAQILSEVWALQDVARMVGEHHERVDGGGYPVGKAGEEITIGGRIIAVADTLDTILSDRPYSKAKPLSWALDEFQRCAGRQFDTEVVAALLRLAEKQPPTFFVNSARDGENRVRTFFAIEGGKGRSEVSG